MCKSSKSNKLPPGSFYCKDKGLCFPPATQSWLCVWVWGGPTHFKVNVCGQSPSARMEVDKGRILTTETWWAIIKTTVRKHCWSQSSCWQNYPSTTASKAQKLTCKGTEQVSNYRTLMSDCFSRSQLKQSDQKNAFLGEGMDIRWEQRSGAGIIRTKLRVKGLQQGK